MTMGEYIKQLRIQHGMSQDELGRLCGVNRAAVNKWETGVTENIKRSVIKTLSEIFQVSPNEILCIDAPAKTTSFRTNRVPLLGAASCGTGTGMAILEDIARPEFISADCAFQIHGESMASKNIHDGDIVYCKRGPVRDNGIGCVRWNDEYFLKTISYGPDFISLQSDIPTIYITGEQEDAEIIGAAVYVLHQI